MSERDKTIDIAKGIGIVLVVWGHTMAACPFRQEIYLFHMPLFFILSGYCFTEKKNSLSEILKKNIRAYLIPYIVFFIILLSAFVAMRTATGTFDRSFISWGILFYPYGVVTALWFLLSLFEVRVAYELMCYYRLSEKKKWTISFVCLGLGYLFSSTQVPLPLFVDSSLSMLFFFHVGYLLKERSILNVGGRKRFILLMTSILFYAGGVALHLVVDIKINKLSSHLLVFIGAALGGTFLLLYISRWIGKFTFASNVLKYLGENTLIIFAIHLLVFDMMKLVLALPELTYHSYLQGGIFTVLGIIGSLIIGIPIRNKILSPLKTFKINP